jgi:transaldolase
MSSAFRYTYCRCPKFCAPQRFHAGRHVRAHVAHVVKTPSSATGADLLEQLKNHTIVLSDDSLEVLTKPQDAKSSAAVVNFGLLSHILANTSAFYELANAIEKGVAKEAAEHPGDIEAALDQALVNVAQMLKDSVLGRIAVEVDPREANDKEALLQRARSLVRRFAGSAISTDRLLLEIPGTWAGLQAVKELEAEGIQCQLIHVYSFAQAVAAVKAAVSTLVVNITHVNLWYDRNPGAIRDPHGPRQDAGCDSTAVNVGVRVATAIYCYAHQHGATKVIVSGVRKQSEALQLSGVDYMVVPSKIASQMEGQGTLQGYNDGFTGISVTDDSSGIPVLTEELAKATEFRVEEVADVSESDFERELGMAGLELLQARVKADCASVETVAEFLSHLVVARE